MLRKTTLAFALLTLGFGSTAAFADECSGRDHTTGSVLGAIAGGVLGGAASNGNAGGVIGGALLGGLAGNAISRDLDCNDRPYAARTYQQSFSGPVGRRYAWNNGPNRGYVTNTREYRVRGEICRDFTQVTYRRGREFTQQGTACRPANRADWRVNLPFPADGNGGPATGRHFRLIKHSWPAESALSGLPGKECVTFLPVNSRCSVYWAFHVF